MKGPKGPGGSSNGPGRALDRAKGPPRDPGGPRRHPEAPQKELEVSRGTDKEKE